MMVLPILLLTSINTEALYLAASSLLLVVWWAFLFWGVWAGVSALWGMLP